MSTPYHLMACLNEPYNHGRFLKCEIRDIKGMLEPIRRGIENHAWHFPDEKINARYLNSYACRISQLEDEVDSWRRWAFQLQEEEARSKVEAIWKNV